MIVDDLSFDDKTLTSTKLLLNYSFFKQKV